VFYKTLPFYCYDISVTCQLILLIFGGNLNQTHYAQPTKVSRSSRYKVISTWIVCQQGNHIGI